MDKSRIQKAGMLKVYVPEGFTCRSGNNMGEADDTQVWIQKEPVTFFDYYWIIRKDDADSIEHSISMTMTVNEGCERLQPFSTGETEWSGVTYLYRDVICNVLKGKRGNAYYQVTVIGHDVMAEDTREVLGAICDWE